MLVNRMPETSSADVTQVIPVISTTSRDEARLSQQNSTVPSTRHVS